MAKYSYEFKKKVVMEYLHGEGGTKYLAKKYNIPSKTPIANWVKNYECFGEEGLKRSRNSKEYSFEQKLFVVQSYLSSELSYQEIALQEGICNPSIIAKWVNDFRNYGTDALKPHKKGRKKSLNTSKGNSKVSKKESNTDTNSEYLKKLEDENLRLRIENAFLKEMRRLRLEEEALLKELRESSTASEENLD